MVAWTSKIDIDGRNARGQAIAACLGLLPLLGVLPLLPVGQPGVVVLAFVEVDVEAPADGSQPLVFQGVELLDGNAAHLRPRLVLEGVVVEELAPQQERNGQHAPDLAFGVVVLPGGVHHVDTLGQVVHSKKDGGAGESGGGQDLRDELAKRSVDSAPGHDQARRHLGHVVSHQLDLVVEDSADTSGHLDEVRPRDESQVESASGEIWICFKQLEIRLSNVGVAALRWLSFPEAEESQKSQKTKRLLGFTEMDEP